MKKTLLATLAVMTAFMVSCEPENVTPTVSFQSPMASLVDGVATLSISVTDYTGDAVSIPVTFAGTAEKGVDYIVSADEFVVGGASPVTEITVTPTSSGDGKTVTATIAAPTGFALGQIPTCQVEVTGFPRYITFQSRYGILKGSLDITVQSFDAAGSSLVFENAGTIGIEVVPESTTAVEGTHFEFDGGTREVAIDAGEDSGVFTINLLKYEEGADKLTLRITKTSQFSLGQYDEMEITLSGPDWDNISGKWTMNEIVTDEESFKNDIGQWMTITLDGFPQLNTADAITIDTQTGKFTPDMQSEFKNYFIGKSNMTRGEEYNLRVSNDIIIPPVRLQLLELDNVNRYFTEGNVSVNKTALVGVQIILDENGEELLDMYIIDYEPHSFLKELIDAYYIDPSGTPPVAATTGAFINMTFKRAE